VLNGCPHLSFVTAINTVGNGLYVDVATEAPLLAPSCYGGLGGAAVHAVALGNSHHELSTPLAIMTHNRCTPSPSATHTMSYQHH